MLRKSSDLLFYTFLVFLCFLNFNVFIYVVSLLYYFKVINI